MSVKYIDVFYYFTSREDAEDYIYSCLEAELIDFDEKVEQILRLSNKAVIFFANELRQKLLRSAH